MLGGSPNIPPRPIEDTTCTCTWRYKYYQLQVGQQGISYPSPDVFYTLFYNRISIWISYSISLNVYLKLYSFIFYG